jgi:cyclic pyranopterin phosphate synthase
MVDVGGKRETVREAVARGEVVMAPATLRLITDRSARKGDVLQVAQVAAIAAAKRTWELIPLCHPIPLTGIAVDLTADPGASRVRIEARVRTIGRTGAEMEALVAVATAGLTVYDMLKAAERGMRIENLRLMRKSGGKSGTYVRREPAGRRGTPGRRGAGERRRR